jgi:hypothetical protein
MASTPTADTLESAVRQRRVPCMINLNADSLQGLGSIVPALEAAADSKPGALSPTLDAIAAKTPTRRNKLNAFFFGGCPIEHAPCPMPARAFLNMGVTAGEVDEFVYVSQHPLPPAPAPKAAAEAGGSGSSNGGRGGRGGRGVGGSKKKAAAAATTGQQPWLTAPPVPHELAPLLIEPNGNGSSAPPPTPPHCHLWVASPAGPNVLTSAHFDDEDNLLCVLPSSPGAQLLERDPRDYLAHYRERQLGQGEKLVALWPPEATPTLRTHSLGGEWANRSGLNGHTLLGSDLFGDPGNVHEFGSFCAPSPFRAVGVPLALRFRVKPGQALFIPAGWWHAVLSDRGCVAVNYWFPPPADVPRGHPLPSSPPVPPTSGLSSVLAVRRALGAAAHEMAMDAVRAMAGDADAVDGRTGREVWFWAREEGQDGDAPPSDYESEDGDDLDEDDPSDPFLDVMRKRDPCHLRTDEKEVGHDMPTAAANDLADDRIWLHQIMPEPLRILELPPSAASLPAAPVPAAAAPAPTPRRRGARAAGPSAPAAATTPTPALFPTPIWLGRREVASRRIALALLRWHAHTAVTGLMAAPEKQSPAAREMGYAVIRWVARNVEKGHGPAKGTLNGLIAVMKDMTPRSGSKGAWGGRHAAFDAYARGGRAAVVKAVLESAGKSAMVGFALTEALDDPEHGQTLAAELWGGGEEEHGAGGSSGGNNAKKRPRKEEEDDGKAFHRRRREQELSVHSMMAQRKHALEIASRAAAAAAGLTFPGFDGTGGSREP